MVTNFHKLILEKFSYEAKNTLGNKHELSYKSDSAVLAAYTVISLYNALTMIFPVLAISGSTGGAPSWITIILNVVVLIRLNIGTYIKKKECEDNASDELRGKGIVNKIDIKTWQIRLGIIIAGYIIDILIAIYYL